MSRVVSWRTIALLGSVALVAAAGPVEALADPRIEAPGGVTVTVTVLPARIAVVDQDGGILELWCNSEDRSAPLIVRAGQVDGPTVETTASVQAGVDALATEADWSAVPGHIYMARARPWWQALVSGLVGLAWGLGR